MVSIRSLTCPFSPMGGCGGRVGGDDCRDVVPARPAAGRQPGTGGGRGRRRRAPALRARPRAVGAVGHAAQALPGRRAARARRLDPRPCGRVRRAAGRPRRPGPARGAGRPRAVGATRVHVAADFGPYGSRPRRAVEAALAEHDIELVRTGLAVRRGAGPGDQGRRDAVRRVHAVQQGVGRARLAGADRRAARRHLPDRRRHHGLPDLERPDGLSLPDAGEDGGPAPVAARSSPTGSTPTAPTATSPASPAPRR